MPQEYLGGFWTPLPALQYCPQAAWESSGFSSSFSLRLIVFGKTEQSWSTPFPRSQDNQLLTPLVVKHFDV